MSMSAAGGQGDPQPGRRAASPPSSAAPPTYPPPPPQWPPPSPPRRSAVDILRIVGAVVLVMASIGLRIWGMRARDDQAARPAPAPGMAPTHPFADTVSPRRLPPGACVDRAPVDFVRTVPCDQRHLAEIVAVFAFPGPPGGPYPPVIDLYRQSLDRCKAEFDAYTATPPDQTPASSFVAVPAPYEWDGGERLIVCYASARNGGDLTASVRGGRD